MRNYGIRRIYIAANTRFGIPYILFQTEEEVFLLRTINHTSHDVRRVVYSHLCL
jgi:hypothetical protein